MSRTVTVPFAWRHRFNQVLNWVFPTDDENCIVCSRPVVHSGKQVRQHHGSPQMCLFCRQELDLCQLRPDHHQLHLPGSTRILEVYSCVVYDQFIRTLLRAFKYDGVIDLVPFFGDMLADMCLSESFDDANLVVPVPSSPDRTAKRGYDHVRLLTNHLSQRAKLLTKSALLRQSLDAKFTQSQTAKTAADRRHGTKEAYQWNRQISVRGCHVVVVDDIVTTGSTLAACAQRLYAAGASDVSALVIARVL